MKCPVDICHLGIQLSGMVLCGKWHYVLFWLLYMVYFKENAPVKGAAEKSKRRKALFVVTDTL